MTTYYFLGSHSSIGNYGLLNYFGQQITLPEDVYEAIRIKVPLVTKQQFDSVKFTSAELRQWAQPGSHDSAPQDFLEKKALALKVWSEGDTPVATTEKPTAEPKEPSHAAAEDAPLEPANT
jgi:hypothetical protein